MSTIPGLTRIETKLNFFKGKGNSVQNKVKLCIGKKSTFYLDGENEASLFSNIPNLLAFRKVFNSGANYGFLILVYILILLVMNLKF